MGGGVVALDESASIFCSAGIVCGASVASDALRSYLPAPLSANRIIFVLLLNFNPMWIALYTRALVYP